MILNSQFPPLLTKMKLRSCNSALFNNNHKYHKSIMGKNLKNFFFFCQRLSIFVHNTEKSVTQVYTRIVETYIC